MKLKTSHSASESASAVLPKLAEKYFGAGRKAAKEKAPRKLHRFRIETKRFRYTLELFQPIYGPGLDRHLKSLRGIQEALGKVSDYQTIQEMVRNDTKLKARLEQATKKNVKEFHQQWKKFDSGGQVKRWKTYLTRPRRVRAAASRTSTKRTGHRTKSSGNKLLERSPMLK